MPVDVWHTMSMAIDRPGHALSLIDRLRGGGKYRLPWEALRENATILANQCQAYRIYAFQVDKVWRVRRLTEPRPFPHLKDLGHPLRATDFGRCHTPSSPMFYCSGRSDIALTELAADLGQHYAIACYEVLEPLNAIAIGEFDYFWRTDEAYFGRLISEDNEDYRNLGRRSDAHILRAIDAFFADEFMKPAYTACDYRLTSAIADVLLNWDSRVDTLVYPSVAFREGLNFAITPEAFRRKLKIVSRSTTIRQIMDVCGFGIFGYQDTQQLLGVGSSGELTWQPVND